MLKASDLETKVESIKKDFDTAEAALSVRDMELASMQCNLKELEELREMKEVQFSIIHNFSRVVLHTEHPLCMGKSPYLLYIFYLIHNS